MEENPLITEIMKATMAATVKGMMETIMKGVIMMITTFLVATGIVV